MTRDVEHVRAYLRHLLRSAMLGGLLNVAALVWSLWLAYEVADKPWQWVVLGGLAAGCAVVATLLFRHADVMARHLRDLDGAVR